MRIPGFNSAKNQTLRALRKEVRKNKAIKEFLSGNRSFFRKRALLTELQEGKDEETSFEKRKELLNMILFQIGIVNKFFRSKGTDTQTLQNLKTTLILEQHEIHAEENVDEILLKNVQAEGEQSLVQMYNKEVETTHSLAEKTDEAVRESNLALYNSTQQIQVLKDLKLNLQTQKKIAEELVSKKAEAITSIQYAGRSAIELLLSLTSEELVLLKSLIETRKQLKKLEMLVLKTVAEPDFKAARRRARWRRIRNALISQSAAASMAIGLVVAVETYRDEINPFPNKAISQWLETESGKKNMFGFVDKLPPKVQEKITISMNKIQKKDLNQYLDKLLDKLTDAVYVEFVRQFKEKLKERIKIRQSQQRIKGNNPKPVDVDNIPFPERRIKTAIRKQLEYFKPHLLARYKPAKGGWIEWLRRGGAGLSTTNQREQEIRMMVETKVFQPLMNQMVDGVAKLAEKAADAIVDRILPTWVKEPGTWIINNWIVLIIAGFILDLLLLIFTWVPRREKKTILDAIKRSPWGRFKYEGEDLNKIILSQQ